MSSLPSSSSSTSAAATTSYFLALRPCIEIFAISDASISGGNILRPISGSRGSILGGSAADSADLVGLASAISSEAYEAARVVTQSKTSSLLLLLTTGGVLYLLFSKRGDEGGFAGQRPQRAKWRSKGDDWFSWLFNGGRDEEDNNFMEADASLVVRGRYFGPSAAPRGSGKKTPKGILKNPAVKAVSLNEALNTRYNNTSFLAPCPNCERGSCRIRRHLQLRVHDKSSSSSHSNSPSHSSSPSCSKGATPAPEEEEGGGGAKFPPTSTAESADDELSPDEDNRRRRQQLTVAAHLGISRNEKNGARFFSRVQGFDGALSSATKSHRLKPKKGSSTPPPSQATAKLYSSSRNRIPPEGRERLSVSSSPMSPISCISPVPNLRCPGESCSDPLCSGLRNSMERDESMNSISVSGSMMNLVQSSKEVRRMIREASFDSLASDFSLDFGHASGFGVSKESLGSSLYDKDMLSNSKSEYGLSQSGEPNNAASISGAVGAKSIETDGSGSDLIDHLPSAARPAHFLCLTHVDSPLRTGTPGTGTEPESLEWESPLHGWHDLRHNKYKVALGSSRSASEFGGDDAASFVTNEELDGLEWDCEGFAGGSSSMDGLQDARELHGHKNWLPESFGRVELDLEAELEGGSNLSSRVSSANTSRSGSRRPSLDKFYYWNRVHVRQPPSGRSSVERGSGDTPRQAIDNETLIKSFGVRVDAAAAVAEKQLMCASTCSEESGFAEGGGPAMDLSINSINNLNQSMLTLSPVHEAKEEQPGSSANTTPVRKGKTARRYQSREEQHLGRRRLFGGENRGSEEEEVEQHIQVVMN